MAASLNVKPAVAQAHYYFTEVGHRRSVAAYYYRELAAGRDIPPLTPEQKAAVHKVWHGREGLYDPRWFDLFAAFNPSIGSDVCYFIPFDYWMVYIEPHIVSDARHDAIDDKNIYDLLFHDMRQPATILHKMRNGLFTDSAYGIIDRQQAVEYCRAAGHVVAKNSYRSGGGKGIHFWKAEEDSVESLEWLLDLEGERVVQAVVRQHPAMAALCSTSCNTVRLLTYIDGNGVAAVSSFVRFGKEGALVDNVSSGGLLAAIAEDGTVQDYGLTGNGDKVFLRRPHEASYVIPGYGKCWEQAKRVAPRLASVSRVIQWDFAIDEAGEPVLIEVNLGWTGMQYYQVLSGPVMKDYLLSLLTEVPIRRIPQHRVADLLLRLFDR